jgi:hypothetical protein
MSDEYSPETSATPRFALLGDAFIPVIILSISVIILLGWQVKLSSAQKTLMQDALTRGTPALNQSQQVQASVSKLVTDLMQAAQTDGTARAIVSKYKIQQAAPPQ